VQANPDKPWWYTMLSQNPNTIWEIVQANPDKPWSYPNLSLNPNVTWEIVQANPDRPWSYLNLSLNPNVTWEIVRDNQLSRNKFTKHIYLQVSRCRKLQLKLSWSYGKNWRRLTQIIQYDCLMAVWIVKEKSLPNEIGHLICEHLIICL
jgi:hypothetical protein